MGIPLIQRILDEALKLNFPVFVTVINLQMTPNEKIIISKTNAVLIEVENAEIK